jgi:hypothetical protein
MINVHQQQRLLSHLHIFHNQHDNAQPRHQFILDLQAWLESLISQNLKIILTMDANDGYDPNNSTQTHSLTYKERFPTLDKT